VIKDIFINILSSSISVRFNDVERSILEYVKEVYKKYKSVSHGFDHVMRVYNLSVKIGVKENADINVLKIAALLHDVGRVLYGEREHALKSAKIAKELLSKMGLEKEFISRVVEAIKAHSFSGKERPVSIEAKVLSDADKLDAIGAIGIARCFMYAGEHKRSLEKSIEHFYEKLFLLKDLMYTKTAKEIAIQRHIFMEKYLQELKAELNMLK